MKNSIQFLLKEIYKKKGKKHNFLAKFNFSKQIFVETKNHW